jgi:hypothetical protein
MEVLMNTETRCGDVAVRTPNTASSDKARTEKTKDKRQSPWNWNKIGMGVSAAAAVAGAAVAARRYMKSDSGEDDFQLRLETDENMLLIASNKVEGTPVVDRNGSRIGTIDNFMVDKYTGRVAYAVMSFGGTFGFGSSLFPLPWPLLDYDEEKGGYVLDIDKEEVADAPRFERNTEPEFDPAFRRRVILFYSPNAV